MVSNEFVRRRCKAAESYKNVRHKIESAEERIGDDGSFVSRAKAIVPF